MVSGIDYVGVPSKHPSAVSPHVELQTVARGGTDAMLGCLHSRC